MKKRFTDEQIAFVLKQAQHARRVMNLSCSHRATIGRFCAADCAANILRTRRM